MSQLMKQAFRNYFFPLLLAASFISSAGSVQAAEFTIRDARTHLVDGVYKLEADIHYQFSDPVHEALANGVPITISLQIVVEQQRDYLWNRTVTSFQQQSSIQYHALSGQYIIRNLGNGRQQSFRSLNSALLTLGEVHELPLLEEALVKNTNAVHQVRVRSEIDINALPAPLRPVAWLSYEWKLISDWFVCPLNS